MFKWLEKVFGKKKKEEVKTPKVEVPKVETKVEETQPKVEGTPWLDIAYKEMGEKEVSGSKHNDRILEYHSVTTLKATDDETPWCSSFVSWCLEKAGVQSTKNAWARSYMKWGKPISKPVKGCIAVFTRGNSSGHVAFFLEDNGLSISCLGGNQGNKVCISSYPKARLLGYRMPA